MGYKIDLTGKTFGRLTVIGVATNYPNKNKRNDTIWECQCECGKKTFVSGFALRNGHTKSCGCYRKDVLKPLVSERSKIHGYSNTRIYNIWNKMMKRCYDSNNKNFDRYGGRGIIVCEEWHSIENIVEWAYGHGYSDELTIDRIDNDGNYCPTNCRWADKITQSNNTSRNHLITYGDKTMTIAEWARFTGLTYSCLKSRIRNGWNIKDALFTPNRTTYQQQYK